MKSPYDVLLEPVFTEKTYDLIPRKTYSFIVAMDSNKTEIKQAVEAAFDVQVKSVNTIKQLGKIKKQGRTQGRRRSVKKAYITLTKDSKGIEAFDGLAQ